MRRRTTFMTILTLLCAVIMPLFASTAFSYSKQQALVIATVNFREEPNSTAKQIRYLKTGEVLDVITVVNSFWLHVKDQTGVLGYVTSSSKYVELSTVKVDPNAEVISSVNFRTGPSTSFESIRFLKSGESVWILEKVNDYWYKLADSNQVIGYASTNQKYIKLFEELASPEPEEQIFKEQPNATILSSVSYRTGPSTSYARIRYLQAGEKLLILERVSDGWYKATDMNDVTAYVTTGSNYVETTFTEPYKLLEPSIAAQMVIDTGMKYLGTPYEFGSSRYDTTTFDCSDFVKHIFNEGIGYVLPGDSRTQGALVKEKGNEVLDWRQLKPGDLLFFMAYKGYKASDYEGIDKSTETVRHVGIYLGDGQMLNTRSIETGGVRVDTITGTYWEYRFLFGGSAL